jgi:hypothetical protein
MRRERPQDSPLPPSGKATSKRNCDAPRSISGRHRRIAHCGGLQRRRACFQGGSRPAWAARPKRGPRPPRAAGATGSGRDTRAPGAARSRRADPDHPCELRAAVLHRPMRAGGSTCHSLLRDQKEAGDLPHRYFGVVRNHSESGRQSAGRSVREGNEPVMRSRCLIAQPFRRDGGLLRGRRAATAARRCPPPLRAYQDADAQQGTRRPGSRDPEFARRPRLRQARGRLTIGGLPAIWWKRRRNHD